MALARGHAGLATVVSGQSRLHDALASPNHFPSQFCLSFSKGSRMPSASKQRLGMPRTAAASATMVQSMTRIADTFAALKQQGKGKSCSGSERCGYGVVRRNPGVWCKGGRREEVLKMRAVSADGGGGEGNNGERFGRGGGGGDNGGGGGDGGGESSDGDGAAPKAASGFLAWYMDQTNRHPVSTKAITAAILNLVGDIFCQLVINKSDKIDIKRTAVITFLGFILVGPTLHTWYLALSKVVTATGFTGAAIRLVLDQFLFSPAFVALFFASLLTLEGRPKDIVPKLKQDWKPAVIANWKLWIPFQFVNFLFVPQQLQVAFANVIALAWNVYLSFASHKAVDVAIPSATVNIEMSPFDDEK